MTAYPTVTECATCGALETAHEIRADGTRGKRLGMVAGSTSNVACPGFVAGATIELVPAGVLRKRLDAVLALTLPDCPPGLGEDLEPMWALGYAHALTIAKQTARGERGTT